MNDIAIKARDEIVKLHSGIITAARRSVQDAIKIGQILSEQKERMEHGKFLKWIEPLPFDERTARRYMAIYRWKDKTARLSDLQEAYKQIETIEAQERRTEDERKHDLIKQYERTGKKPEGWDRSLDYALKKKKEEDAAFEERKQKAFQEGRTAATEDNFSELSSMLRDASTVIIQKEQERAAWKDKIRISDSGKEDQFLDAILEYLSTLADDNRRIEACQNIIKICKNIAVELQRNKVA